MVENAYFLVKCDAILYIMLCLMQYVFVETHPLFSSPLNHAILCCFIYIKQIILYSLHELNIAAFDSIHISGGSLNSRKKSTNKRPNNGKRRRENEMEKKETERKKQKTECFRRNTCRNCNSLRIVYSAENRFRPHAHAWNFLDTLDFTTQANEWKSTRERTTKKTIVINVELKVHVRHSATMKFLSFTYTTAYTIHDTNWFSSVFVL